MGCCRVALATAGPLRSLNENPARLLDARLVELNICSCRVERVP
jgi:hypothetical protein